MDIKKMFPNKYLSGDDLGGRSLSVKIARITSEEMPAKRDYADDADDAGKPALETKWVIYFDGKNAGRVLNKTVAGQIAEALGEPDTDKWIGRWVDVYPVWIRAFGKRKNVVHFRRATKIPAEKPAPAAVAVVDAATGEVLTNGQPPAE